ncbi:hypothetical protein [Sulfoacidibacillus ferrooxidans]|uniref:hypothetical protein n=1 Tax=Sulfoacidibacillus ferrooxidans TaxID=2005001 RepID=UPI001F51132F|nr:hypothetical protein [Sulfoacidibacillus ferrooxidans]
MYFETTDQFALRKDARLEAFKPVKNRFIRIESIQCKRLLFVRTPNLIDSPVLEISAEVEALLQNCTGEYTVKQLEASICPQARLKEKLLYLYEYSAIIFS